MEHYSIQLQNLTEEPAARCMEAVPPEFRVHATSEPGKEQDQAEEHFPDVQEVFESIPGANVEAREGVDPCEVALNKLEEYFAAKYHDVFERNLFWTLKPEEEEPLEKILLRVMDSAKKCNFGASAQESLEIGIIDTMTLQSPTELREKLLAQEKLTLEGLTRIVNAHGSLKHHIRQFSCNDGYKFAQSL